MTIQAVSADGVVHEFPDETDTGVIGKAMRDYAASNLSVSGDLKGGLHDLGTSVSQGLGAVGATGAANFVKGYTPDAPAGPAPSEQLAGAVEHGDWGNVPGLLMHSAARAIPSAAPIIAGGAIGGPLAAGAAAGALALGPEAYGRAANNGRSEPTTSDTLGAIPGALGEAAGGALIPGPATGTLLKRTLGRVASDVAGGAVMDTAGQLGASVGTDKGTSYDPYQTASSALTQGAIGAGRGVKDAAGEGVKAGVDRAVASTLETPTDTADLHSIIRSTNLMDQVRQNDINTTGKARPDTAIANSVKQDLLTKLNGQVRDLRDAGLIDRGDYSDLNTLIGTQALRGNNTISDSAGSLFGRLGSLGLPDEITSQIKDDVRDLNTLSTQSFQKNTTGPFEAAGKVVGRVGAVGAGLMSGSPMGMIEGVMGNPIAGKVGGMVGSGLDRAFGTNTPPIVLQRLNAARALRNLGFDPNDVPATADTVSNNPRVLAAQNAQAAAPANAARAEFNTTSANDQAALDAQAAQAVKVKQAQMDSAYKQNQQFQSQVDTAYDQNQTKGPSIDDYLNGKINDPSVLPPSKMTTPQEIALQVQRLRNAQIAAKQAADQQAVLTKATASTPEAMGQLALDKLTRNNATTLAAADQTPTSRPDLVPEAGAAAQGMMQARAQRILGNADDGVTVGNPPNPIPVNTPIPAPSSPAQRLQQAQATVAATPPQTAPTTSTEAPTATPLSAPAGHPASPTWERLVANGNPTLTRQQVRDAAAQVHGPDALAVLDAHKGSVSIPQVVAPIQAKLGQNAAGPSQLSGGSDQPAIRSPTRYANAVNTYHAHVANDVAALQQAGNPTAAHALLDIAVNHHTKAAKQAARAALPKEIGSLIPDYIVNQGGT